MRLKAVITHLVCSGCPWTYTVEMRPDLPVSAIRRDCSQCNNPTHIQFLEAEQPEIVPSDSALMSLRDDYARMGIKTLTRHDCHWLASGPRTHQHAESISLDGFEQMFSDIQRSEENPRTKFRIRWHGFSAENLVTTENEVVWYDSNGKWRLLMPKDGRPDSHVLQEGNILLIERLMADVLSIRVLKSLSRLSTADAYIGGEAKVRADRVITGFANRASPLLVALKVTSDSIASQSGASIRFDDLLPIVENSAVLCRKILEKREAGEGIPRGERVSSGFPKDSDDSIRRWASTYLGYMTDRRGELRGGLVDMGLIAQSPNDWDHVILTVPGRDLANNLKLSGLEDGNADFDDDADNVNDDEDPFPLDGSAWLDTDDSDRGPRPGPGLPIATESDATSFLDYLSEYMTEEWSFITDCAKSMREWTTTADLIDRIANTEISRYQRNNSWARWRGRGGIPWVERDAQSRTKADQELSELELISKKAMPYLSGLLGRLWEMGLVEKDGSRKRMEYKLSDFGDAVLLD